MNHRLASLGASIDRVRRELRGVHDEVRALHAELDTGEHASQQLAAIENAERQTRDRLARLEPVLQAERVGTHVRSAIERAERREAPVAHAIVHALLPDAVYAAIADAVPEAAFFEPRGDQQEVRLPPALAPTYSIVTWSFLVGVFQRHLVPALSDRFDRPPGQAAIPRARLVSLRDGRLRLAAGGPEDWLTVLFDVERTTSRAAPDGAVRSASGVMPLPARGALVFLHPVAPLDVVPAARAMSGGEHYICELRVGVRRSL